MDYQNQRVISIISQVGNYLREPLPDTKQAGIEHLTGLEKLRFDLLEVTVDWQKLLAEKKSQYLHPKDPNFTELDRTTMLNATIANIQRDVSFLVELNTLITQRLELAKTIY